MLREIRYIIAVLLVKLHMWMAYRLKLVVWIISGLVEPIVWSVLWYAVAKSSAEQGQDLLMSGAEIMTYYLFISLVSRLTRSWTFDTLRNEIRIGRYSRYLLWPSSVVGFRLGADISNKIITVLALLPFWIIWLVVLKSQGLLTMSFENLLLFALALVTAVVVRFLMDMVLAHLVLWFQRADGLSVVYYTSSRLFGGVIVPLAFLPSWLASLVYLLPFRYIYSFPIEIFQGTIQGDEITKGFAVVVTWILFFSGCMLYIFKFGMRKYEAQGI